jgi:hypothetical protein
MSQFSGNPRTKRVGKMRAITIVCHSDDVTGPHKYSIKQHVGAPLFKGITPPEIETFATFADAHARALQLQAETGGRDRIEVRDLRKKVS